MYVLEDEMVLLAREGVAVEERTDEIVIEVLHGSAEHSFQLNHLVLQRLKKIFQSFTNKN